MMDPQVRQLCDAIRDHAARHGVTPGTVSERLFGAGTRLRQLEQGSNIGVSTLSRARARLAEMNANPPWRRAKRRPAPAEEV